LEILQLPDIFTETGQQSLRLLKTETQRMSRLVHRMLELGRLETSAEIELGPIALLGVVERAVAQMTPEAEERQIALSLQADTPLPLVLGNADYLLQVFLNLLDNGCKYSRSGDRVEVSLQRSPDGVACAVCDTGPGIPAEHLPHVTRRFYRADRRGVEGSGLGLALVKEILRRHQSRLEIESHAEGEETGTCARFVLPVSKGEVE
jgi:two-component system phosphate regulon sensor histidine kinase PhoR